jgi:hypothetical protein
VNLTVSPPIKILALVLVLAGVAFVASLSLMGKSTTVPTGERRGTEDVQRVNTAPAVTTPAKSAAKPDKAVTTAKPDVKPAATKPVVKAPPKAKAKPKPVQRGNLVYSTLPRPLQWALSQHKIVVVALYNPNADVDAIAVAEAHQGAVDAGAGFLLVSVLDDKVAGILTALLPGGGLLPDPGVLVYRAPGDIAFRLDGFNDRHAVAQAATNAAVGDSDPAQAVAAAAPAAAPTVPPATLTP